MENKQLVEYKEGFISKVRKFFKNLFRKNKHDYSYTQEVNSVNNQAINKTNEDRFLNDIKVDNNIVSKEINLKKFLQEIDGNKEALNKLSIDRLKKLEKYYDNVIKENEKKIIKANG